MWLDGGGAQPEPEPEPEQRRGAKKSGTAVDGPTQRRRRSQDRARPGVRSRGVPSGTAARSAAVLAIGGGAPGRGARSILPARGDKAHSMPAAQLKEHLDGITALPLPGGRAGVSSMPAAPVSASPTRLAPLPHGFGIAVDGPEGQPLRKQLFGGSSVVGGGSFSKPRDPVLDPAAVSRGREIAEQIAALDVHIESALGVPRKEAEARKHALLTELKRNPEIEMVVINLRLGLKAHKAWGDHAFPSLAGKGPPETRSNVVVTQGEVDLEVEAAAAVVIERAFAVTAAGDLAPGRSVKNERTSGEMERLARAPVEVEDGEFSAAFRSTYSGRDIITNETHQHIIYG